MPRPYWSGHIQISLVSFGVKLFTATESKSEIRFHQINRKTGERIRHQKTSGDEEAVSDEDVVKGYEYRKGEYVIIEPEEIEHLRVPSRHILDVSQFVGENEVDPSFFEKPYFVLPENEQQATAFAVIRKALHNEKKFALGKITIGGREQLVAIGSPANDKFPGMMAYTLRYDEELRDAREYFGDIENPAVEDGQLSMAKQLIKHKTAKFDPEKFKDEYEVALRELIEAKVENRPLPKEEPAPKPAKVIDLMDALRKSIQGVEKAGAVPKKKPESETNGLALVKKPKKTRKSA